MPFGLFKIQLLDGLFLSGLPFPKVLSRPMSWVICFWMQVVSWILQGLMPIPTLSSTNAMLVGMVYLLACTSKNIETCPMEGYLTWGASKPCALLAARAFPHVSRGYLYVRPTSGTGDGNSKEMGTPPSLIETFPQGNNCLHSTVKCLSSESPHHTICSERGCQWCISLQDDL
jgi:hypothetical protein